MGGRIHGFLGGVLLTSSIVYYTSTEFRKNSKFISNSLKESKAVIDNRNLPITQTSKKIEYESRDSIIETSKDIWNEEVIKSINRLYSISWVNLGHKLDEKLKNLINKS